MIIQNNLTPATIQLATLVPTTLIETFALIPRNVKALIIHLAFTTFSNVKVEKDEEVSKTEYSITPPPGDLFNTEFDDNEFLNFGNSCRMYNSLKSLNLGIQISHDPLFDLDVSDLIKNQIFLQKKILTRIKDDYKNYYGIIQTTFIEKFMKTTLTFDQALISLSNHTFKHISDEFPKSIVFTLRKIDNITLLMPFCSGNIKDGLIIQWSSHLLFGLKEIHQQIVVKRLLKLGANPKASIEGKTPLHDCTSIMVAKQLVDAGADINAQDSKGRTPLFKAVENGSLQMVKFLVEAKADVNPYEIDIDEDDNDSQAILRLLNEAIEKRSPKRSTCVIL
jgi:hypothetical protein